MSPELARARPRSKRNGVEFEEERAWVTFYRRVRHDATLAGEVLAQLDDDAEARRSHQALYLCCKESLRLHKARQTRNKRVGHFVRWLCHGLFVSPVLALWRWLDQGGNLAVECLPEIQRETPRARVRQLRRQPESAHLNSDFDELVGSGAMPNGAAAPGVGGPRSANTQGAKAA